MTIEVFKTDVRTSHQADMIIGLLQKAFPCYTATFDLEDCDKILRVICAEDCVRPPSVIGLLKDCGFYAEVLPDEISTISVQR